MRHYWNTVKNIEFLYLKFWTFSFFIVQLSSAKISGYMHPTNGTGFLVYKKASSVKVAHLQILNCIIVTFIKANLIIGISRKKYIKSRKGNEATKSCMFSQVEPESVHHLFEQKCKWGAAQHLEMPIFLWLSNKMHPKKSYCMPYWASLQNWKDGRLSLNGFYDSRCLLFDH